MTTDDELDNYTGYGNPYTMEFVNSKDPGLFRFYRKQHVKKQTKSFIGARKCCVASVTPRPPYCTGSWAGPGFLNHKITFMGNTKSLLDKAVLNIINTHIITKLNFQGR